MVVSVHILGCNLTKVNIDLDDFLTGRPSLKGKDAAQKEVNYQRALGTRIQNED